MSYVCIVIGVIFFVFVLAGWIQGLFKVVVSIAGMVIGLLVATFVAPQVSGYLQANTTMDESIAAYIKEEFQFQDSNEELSKGIQVGIINELDLPEYLKNTILDCNNSEMYEALQVENVYDYIAKTIAVIVLNAIVFLVLAFACGIFCFFFGQGIMEMGKLPIVRGIDKIGGGVLGVVKGIIFIWIFFLVLSFATTTSWGSEIINQISQSAALKWLYDNNILLNIVGDITKILFT